MVSSGATGRSKDADALRSQLSRRAVFVLLMTGVAALTAIGVAYRDRDTRFARTVQLMVHPAPATRSGDVANAMRVLDASGPFMGTLAGTLDDNNLVAAAQARAGTRGAGLAIHASRLAPSDVIAWTAVGYDRVAIDAISAEFPKVAEEYVSSTYPGFATEWLGSFPSRERSFPPHPASIVLASAFGAAAACALVAADARKNRMRAARVPRRPVEVLRPR
jgi:hypothetical protein